MGHGPSHAAGAHGHSHGGDDAHGHAHGDDGACAAGGGGAAGGPPAPAPLPGGGAAQLWAVLGAGGAGSELHLSLPLGTCAREAALAVEVADWAGARDLAFQPLPRPARPAGEGAGACTRWSAKAARMSAAAGPLKVTATFTIDGAPVVAVFDDFYPARHGPPAA